MIRSILLGIAASLLLTACSSIPLSKPLPPTVTVAGVRPTNLSFTSQTLELTLRVANPNRFNLPMESLKFNAQFAGEEFAQGQSLEEVLIPGNGEALLKVEVKTGLAKIANQIVAMLDANNFDLNYDIRGVVKLANWPKEIPFNVEGELTEQLENTINEQLN